MIPSLKIITHASSVAADGQSFALPYFANDFPILCMEKSSSLSLRHGGVLTEQ